MENMTEERKDSHGSWQDTVSLVLGFWLFFSPGVLHFHSSHGETWVAVILGLLLAGFAGAALVHAHMWKQWVLVTLGGLLIAAPWAFGFTAVHSAMWNSIIAGAAVIVCALSRMHDLRGAGKSGHGHGGMAAAS